MKKQALTTSQERKMKYAEAGILVTLVVALTIFVGIRLSGDGSEEPVSASETTFVQETVPVADHPEPATEAAVDVADETVAESVEEPVAEPVEEPISAPDPVTYAVAEQAFQDGDFRAAADLFSRYTAAHPANAWGHYMLGLSAWKAGDPDAAEDAFLHALDLNPNHLKSLVNYGRVLIALDRNEEARDQMELALAANPASLDARRVMGRIQHNLGDLDAAIHTYHEVLTARGDDVWALNNLGLILIEQEKFEEALGPLAKAALIGGDIGTVQNNLGIALERTGHYAAAAEAFARALVAEHDKAEISLARVEVMQEDPDTQPVDLAALAAAFSTPLQEVDMEVASALEAPIPTDETTETDGSRNR